MKLFFILLIILLINTNVNSQNVKPTLEQTVAFINQTLKSAEGKNGDYSVVGNVNFTSDEYSVEDIYLHATSRKRYTDIKWGSYITMTSASPKWSDTDISVKVYTVVFENKLKLEKTFLGKNTSEYRNQFNMILPRVKEESMRKAFDRLKELVIESNKDPFQN